MAGLSHATPGQYPDQHLYLIGDEEFSRISLADIAQHRNGWTDQSLRLRKAEGTSTLESRSSHTN